MKEGKVPENVLKRSVLRQINAKSGQGEGGAGIGRDCAVFSVAEGGIMLSCVQEAVVCLGKPIEERAEMHAGSKAVIRPGTLGEGEAVYGREMPWGDGALELSGNNGAVVPAGRTVGGRDEAGPSGSNGAVASAERTESGIDEAQDAARTGRDSAEGFMTMAELIQKCANNLAAGGARAKAVMVTLLLPEDTEESILRGLMEQAAGKCREMELEIAGGQSRITGAVVSPVAVVTGYGVPMEGKQGIASGIHGEAAAGEPVHAGGKDVPGLPGEAEAGEPVHAGSMAVSGLPGKAAPGQDIVLSKWIGLQGTAVLARRSREKLLGRYPAYLVDAAAGFARYLSVLPEAEIAVENGVCAMHDASEGGILGALWEFAEGSGVGLDIDMRSLPLRQETVEVCECCNANPYELMSGGCLIMACRDGQGLAAALEAGGIPGAVVGKVTAGRERILHNGEETRYMNRPSRDGIYACL